MYQNLPAPTYSHFVMRQQAFAEVVDGIERRSAVVLIASLGGMGKTSLAREIAAHSLREDSAVPHFDAVVWVSDKGKEGTTNLSTVLDAIAQTLDYPGIAQYTHSEKQYEVEQLLRRQRVLLVVDNFETITDGVLLEWLLRLPEPSKAIITTRQYRREFRNSAILVNLHGMTEAETSEAVDERLRVLHMERLVSDPTQLEPLLAATGGNPKAITLTMGLLKYERRPLQQIVDDLYAARGDLFDDLFSWAWALLDDAARRLLMIATFFVDSASIR
ncbi:MAG: AAA family ATPase [Chloroflexaceae bacterium]|nr:AAA family ATPase [Chloroflexaceae bacterium]